VYKYNLDGKQAERDQQKMQVSKSFGITLVVIPYWWKHSKNFLYNQIVSQRPDLLQDYKPRGIDFISQPKAIAKQTTYIPLRSVDFDEETNDPTGLYDISLIILILYSWMSELQVGQRVFWNGNQLRSRAGIPVNISKDLTKDLPLFPIEGILR
jgi:hypothetical protein